MKLKDRDLTERERRLNAANSPLLQQDRLVRTALLTIVLFGVAALAGVVGYLAWPYSFQGSDTRAIAASERFHTARYAKFAARFLSLLAGD